MAPRHTRHDRLPVWVIVAGLCAALRLVASVGWPTSSAQPSASHSTATPPASTGRVELLEPRARVAVPADKVWTDTQVDVPPGAVLHLRAWGSVTVAKSWRLGWDWTRTVGPEGTYDWPRKAAWADWPVPTAARGAAPAFALIAKVGEDGVPFVVGPGGRWSVERPGRLFLGINDFRNEKKRKSARGRLSVQVTLESGGPGFEPKRLLPDPRPWWPAGRPLPPPVRSRRVLLIYVDGVRYDVVKEMAFAGQLPTIKRVFFDGGLDCTNAFTLFPSSTLPATGSLQTGRYNSRHGLKNNVEFNRKNHRVYTYLSAFGPPVAYGFVTHQGRWDMGAELATAWLQSFGSQEEFVEASQKRLQGVPTLHEYCQWADVEYRAGALPLLPFSAGRGFTRTAVNAIPPFGAHLLDRHLDGIMARYGLDYIIRPEHRVMALWFPQVDLTGHESPRGLYGTCRRGLVRLDRMLEEAMEALTQRGMLEETTLILFSDHGREGGQQVTLQGFDMAAEFFYPEAKDEDGDGLLDPGSGLGFNLFKHGYGPEHPPMTHPGTSGRDGAYVMPLGIAEVYLPVGGKHSRDWSRANTFYELTHYQLEENLAPVNLIERCLSLRLPGRNKFPGLCGDRPVEFAMAPLGENVTLVADGEGRQALIERLAGEQGHLYRYTPVRDVTARADGQVSWTAIDPSSEAFEGPLGYVGDPGLLVPPGADRRQWLAKAHPARSWLRATMYTKYPVAVPAIAEFFAWDGELARHRDRLAPDFVLTPARGWNLGTRLGNTTDHGGLRRESMHVPMLLAGPDVPAGYRLEEPTLVVDLAPTALAAAQVAYDEGDFDGRSLWSLVEEQPGDPWWHGRNDAMAEPVAMVPALSVTDYRPYVPAPKTWWERPVLHDRQNPFDIHNIGTDLLALSQLELVTLADRVVDLVVPGPPVRPIDTVLGGAGGLVWQGRRRGSYLGTRFEQIVWALKIRQVALGDIYPFSSGNRERIGGVVDWLQLLLDDGDRAVARPFKREHVLGTPIVNGAIDLAQGGIDLALDTVSYHLSRGLTLAGHGLEHLGGMLVSPFAKRPEPAESPGLELRPEPVVPETPARDVPGY